jgi:hypothetical protein
MHRAVLLTLLAIPILVIMHIALVWQPIPWGSGMFWTTSQDGAHLRGYWQSPERSVPSRFVTDRISKQGS